MKKKTKFLALLMAFIFCLTASPFTTLAANVNDAITLAETDIETETQTESETITEIETETETSTEAVTVQTEEETETEMQTEPETAEQKESEDQTEEVEDMKAPARSSRSAEDYVDYIALRTNKNITTYASVINSSSFVPDGYYGYMRSVTPNVHCAYDTTLDNGEAGITMYAKYRKGGSQEGYVSATYPKSCYYEGQWLDIKLTVLDWQRKSGTSNALIRFGVETLGVKTNDDNFVEVRYDFFKAGTTTPVSVKGYATWKDIDFEQGIVLKDGFLKTGSSLYVNSSTSGVLGYTSINGNPYLYEIGNTSGTSSNPAYQVTALYSGSSITMVYTFIRSSGAASGGIGVSSDKGIPGPIGITKRVSDNDEKLVISDTLNQSPEPRKENFNYTINVEVPGEVPATYYSTLAVKDEIDKGLTVDTSSIKVVNENGINVTSYFDIAVSSSNILGVVAKSAQLKVGGFYGHTYSITVPVTIKDTTDLLKYWDASKEMARIDNKASVTYDGGTIRSDDVHTYVPETKPVWGALKITKTDSADRNVKLSDVTFSVYEWSKSLGAYKTTVYDTLVEDIDNGNTGIYINNKEFLYTADNEYKFKVEETNGTTGYINSRWSKEFQFSSTSTESLTYTVENEKMNPQLKIAKAFDHTKVGDLVNGKYDGVKEPGWYDFSEEAIATLTVSNTGNVPFKDLVVTESMSEELKAMVVDGSAQYVIEDGIKTVKGKVVTVTVDNDDSNVLHISALDPDDSLVIPYKIQILNKDDFSAQQLLELKNVVTVKGTYSNNKEDIEEEDKDEDELNIYNPEVGIVKAALPEGSTELPKYGSEIQKEDEGFWFSYNNEIRYVVKISNDGNTPLYKSIVKDTMDENLKAAVWKSAGFNVGDQITSALGNTINVTKTSDNEVVLDVLEVGDYVYLEYIATVADAKTINELEALEKLVNSVTVNSGYKDPEDPTPIPEEKDQDIVNVRKAKVSITKDADKEIYELGEIVTYTMTVSNDGNTLLYNLKVEDIMEKDLQKAIKDGSASYKIEKTVKTELGNIVKLSVDDAYILNINELAVGDKVTFVFVITLKDTDLKQYENLANAVRVTGAFGDDEKIPEDEDDLAKAKININKPKADKNKDDTSKKTDSTKKANTVKTGEGIQAVVYIELVSGAFLIILFIFFKKRAFKRRIAKED